ncbi:MAG: hypothetical protein KC912_01490 [Proteobacteria bacterium]|nr:hypothetical protein [Pseudomonadota bacterium]
MYRLLLPLLLLSGCAVRHTGFVYGTGEFAELRTLDGRGYPLKLPAQAKPLGYLDGHTTEVEGFRIFRTIHVKDWRVHDGLHGLPTWVGPLIAYGAELGIQDRNSGVFYYVDARAARDLEAYIGDIVLLEGWVQDARRVTVAYFRVLAAPDEEDAPSEAP